MELAPAFVLVSQVSRLYLSSAVTLILLQVWNAFTMNYFLSFVFFCFIVMFDILVLMILIVLIFNVVISVTRVENSHSIPAFCEIKITHTASTYLLIFQHQSFSQFWTLVFKHKWND